MAFRIFLVVSGLLIGGLAALVSCKQVHERCHMNYIIPTGYHGVLVGRAKKGAPGLLCSHGGYTVIFPENGVLEIASTDVFYEWHQGSAAFNDGTPLNVAVVPCETTPNGSGTVELYDLGADSDGLLYWFVGTHDEFAPMQGKDPRNYLTPAQKAILWPPSVTKEE
jgi:hypothetical protein